MLVAGLALAASAAAQPMRGLTIGPQVGVYFPASSETRDLLGSSWWNVGIGPARAEVGEGWRLSSNMKILSRRSMGNDVFMVMSSFGVSLALGRTDDRLVPFIAGRAGPAYMDYSFTRAGRRASSQRVSWNANAEVGIVVDGRLRLSAGYTWLPRQDGLDFSGFSVGATFELFGW
jgi:hypothetical protein